MSATVLEKPQARTADLRFRIQPRAKQALELAAEVIGKTLSDFVIPDAYARAKKILDEQGIMFLDDPDRDAFVQAFVSPQEPIRLKKAIAVYKGNKP